MKSPEGGKQNLSVVLPKGRPVKATTLSEHMNGLAGTSSDVPAPKKEKVEATRLSDYMRAFEKKDEQHVVGGTGAKQTESVRSSVSEKRDSPYVVKDKRSNAKGVTGADLDALRGKITSTKSAGSVENRSASRSEKTEPVSEGVNEDAEWKSVREAYRSHKARIEEAQRAFLEASKQYEEDRHSAGFFGRFLDKSALEEKKIAMIKAQKKYDMLLDDLRGKRQERMKFFFEKKLTQQEKIGARSRRYVARNEALLERYIDNEVQLLEGLRYNEHDTGESRYKYLQKIQRAWNWYRKLPKGKRLGIAALSGAVVGGALGATGLVAGGAAVVGATYATRRAVGGFFGSIVALETKKFGDEMAEQYGKKKYEEQKNVFTEQALSKNRKERLVIKKGVRTRKKFATAGAAGAAVAVGAGTANAIENIADVASIETIDPGTVDLETPPPTTQMGSGEVETGGMQEVPPKSQLESVETKEEVVAESKESPSVSLVEERESVVESPPVQEDVHEPEESTLEDFVPPDRVVGSTEEFVPVSAGDVSAVEEYAIAKPERIVVPKAESMENDTGSFEEEGLVEESQPVINKSASQEVSEKTEDGSEAMEDTMVEIADLYEQLEAKEDVPDIATEDLEAQQGVEHVIYGTEDDQIIQEAPQELKMEGVYEKGSSVEREFQQFLKNDAWVKEEYPLLTDAQRGSIAHRIRLELESHPDMAEKLKIQKGDWNKVLENDSYSFYVDRALVEREINEVLGVQPVKEIVDSAPTSKESEVAVDDASEQKEAIPVLDESKKSPVQGSKSLAEEALEELRQQKEKGMIPPEVDGDNEAHMPPPKYVPEENDPVVPRDSEVSSEIPEKEGGVDSPVESSVVTEPQEPVVSKEGTVTEGVETKEEVPVVEDQKSSGESVLPLEEDMERAKRTMREGGADYQGSMTRPAIEKMFLQEGVFNDLLRGKRPLILSNWGPMSHARLTDILDNSGSLTYTIGEGTPVVMGSEVEQLCRSVTVQLERGLSERIPDIAEMLEQAKKNDVTLGEFVKELSGRLEMQEETVEVAPETQPVAIVEEAPVLSVERMPIDEYERPGLIRVSTEMGVEGADATYRSVLPPVEVSDEVRSYIRTRYISEHPEWEQGSAKALFVSPEGEAFQRLVKTQLADIAIELRPEPDIPLPNIRIDWHAFENMSPREMLEQLEQHEVLLEKENTINKLTESGVSITPTQ